MSPKNKSQGDVFQFLKWILFVAVREQGNYRGKKAWLACINYCLETRRI